MRFSNIFSAIFLIITIPLHAQVINTGGGGPDGHYNKKQLSEDGENSLVRAQRIKKIEQALGEWVKLAKKDWNNCYKEEFKAENIIEVYTQLSLLGEMKPPKLKKKAKDKMIQAGGEDCLEDEKFKCLFSNLENNSKLYNIVNEPSMHDYLMSMEIEKEQSRKDFIKFFKNFITVPQP